MNKLGSFKENNFVYQIGFSILLFLASIVWLATFFFAIGVPIQPFVIPAAAVVSIFVTIYTGNVTLKKVIPLAAALLLIVGVSAVASSYVYDFSFDGNTYHKTTIGMLKNGWNPIYKSFEEATLTLKIIPDDYEWPIWYDHYPKASWIIGAAFYRISGNIETGKCMNILACIAVFFILMGRLKQYQLFGMPARILFALVTVINPVTLPQMQSYYNDGMMQMLIYAALISLINLSITEVKDQCKQDWICLFAAINLALNIKYSGLIFMGLYCAGFYFYWLFRDMHMDRKAAMRSLKKTTLFYCITLGIAICFTGSTSYMRNLIQHKNLLYTMVGEDKIEIIASMLPNQYANKPYAIQFVLSLFSRAANISAGSEIAPELKLPFTFNQAEWETGSLFDLRIGGWGLIFSGIFLLSICLLAFSLYTLLCQRRVNGHLVFEIVLLVVSLTLVQVFFIPGLAWARYYAHLFLIPLIAAGFLIDSRKKVRRFAGYMIFIMLILNVGNFALFSLERISQSQNSYFELSNLSRISKEQKVVVHLNGGTYTQGYLFNLMDAGVNYSVDPNMEDGTTIFNWRLNYKVIS